MEEKTQEMQKQGLRVETLVESPEPKKAKVMNGDQSVRIMSYDDGPLSFFVQFTSMDNVFQEFQCELQDSKEYLEDLSRNAHEGTKCIVEIEGQLHRAEIVKTQAMIRLLESGSKILASKLFKMPSEVAEQPPFAKQCKLAGFEISALNNINQKEINFYFQHITQQKLLTLNVDSDNGSIASCRLFDDGVNILEKLYAWNPRDVKFVPQQPVIGSDHKVKWMSSISSKQKSLSANEEASGSSSLSAAEQNQSWSDENSKKLDDSEWTVPSPSAKAKIYKQTSSASSSSGVSTMLELNQEQREPIRITAVIKPTDLTIQKLSEVDKYIDYRRKLQAVAKSQPPLTNFSEGTFCFAFNLLEYSWCCAVILDFDKKNFFVSVKSLDDGAIFLIQEKEYLRLPNADFHREPYFGIQCSLPLRFYSKHLREAKDYLQKLMFKKLSCHWITPTDEISYVELYNDGKNVADYLVEQGVAKRLFTMASGPAYIVHVNSLSDFSIQIETNSKIMKQIVEYTGNYNYCEVRHPQIGMMVVGRYKADNCWYRAKIMSKEKNGFKVYFIDDAHEEVVEKIGAILDVNIAKIRPLGIKCSLVLPTGAKEFSKDAEKRFKEMFGSGSEKVFVELVKPGDKSSCVDVREEESGASLSEKLTQIDGGMKHSSVTEQFDDSSESDNGF